MNTTSSITEASKSESRRALVFGGTGAIGSAVVADLTNAGINTVFTYYKSEQRAKQLCQQHACTSLQLDLADGNAIRSVIRDLQHDHMTPDIFIHCATEFQEKSLVDISDDDWDRLHNINCKSAFIACQALSEIMVNSKNGLGSDIVLVAAMNRMQSKDMPLHFATSQTNLAAFTTAAAKSLGPLGIRINLITPGLLQSGISSGFKPSVVKDYIQFSALGRHCDPAEVSRVIVWLATQNSYINGQSVPVNGGI